MWENGALFHYTSGLPKNFPGLTPRSIGLFLPINFVQLWIDKPLWQLKPRIQQVVNWEASSIAFHGSK